MIRELEFFMGRWETKLKANLQAYIDQSNTDNGDTLLQAFNSNAFYAWDLPMEDEIVYGIFYSLYPGPNPEPIALDTTNTALKYEVNFDVAVKDNASNSMYRLGHRYIPMLIKLFGDIIIKESTSAGIIDAGAVITQNKSTGARLLVSGITWEITVPY